MSEIVAGNNDRTTFDPAKLKELAESIKAHGLIQPITVRAIEGSDIFQIVCGERRFRACKLLCWETIPCAVIDVSDEDASAMMLAENTARADLDPIDEALAYVRRAERFGWTAKEIAERAGVGQVRVSWRMKLLSLDTALQDLVRTGNFPVGYAQDLAIAGLPSFYQWKAFGAMRDNPSPTPSWFRAVVSKLAETAHQQSLIGDDFMGIEEVELVLAEVAPTNEPALPSTTVPPVLGSTPQEIVQHQINFWTQAAEGWTQHRNSVKRAQCEAAAQALRYLLEALPSEVDAPKPRTPRKSRKPESANYSITPKFIDTAGKTRTWSISDAKGAEIAAVTTKRGAQKVASMLATTAD